MRRSVLWPTHLITLFASVVRSFSISYVSSWHLAFIFSFITFVLLSLTLDYFIVYWMKSEAGNFLTLAKDLTEQRFRDAVKLRWFRLLFSIQRFMHWIRAVDMTTGDVIIACARVCVCFCVSPEATKFTFALGKLSKDERNESSQHVGGRCRKSVFIFISGNDDGTWHNPIERENERTNDSLHLDYRISTSTKCFTRWETTSPLPPKEMKLKS